MTKPASVTVNTLSQYAARACVVLLSLATTSILTRSLGQAGYGQFGIITTAVIFFVTMADWGTQSIAVREAVKDESNRISFFSTTFLLRTVLSGTITILYLAFVFLYPGFASFKIAAVLAAPIIILLSIRTSAALVYQVKLQLYVPAATDLLTGITVLLWLTVSAVKGISVNLNLAILAVLLGTFINVLATLLFSGLKIDLAVFDRALARKLIRESLPMGAFLVVFSVYNRIDSLILQAVKGNSATGVYLLSYKVHENLVLGAAYLMNSLYPIISRSQADAKRVFQVTSTLLSYLALLVVGLGFIFSPLLVEVLGGSGFAPSVPVLRILLFATAISFLNHLTGYTLIALGKQAASLKFALIALIFNLVSNLLLVPGYSYFASALITVATEGLMLILTATFLSQVFNFKISLNPKIIFTFIKSKYLAAPK